MKRARTDLFKAMKDSEEIALEMLVDLFDWMDGLEPLPTTEVVPQNIKAMNGDTHAPIDRVVDKEAKDSTVSCSTRLHVPLESYARCEYDVDQKPASNPNLEQSHIGTGDKKDYRGQLRRM